MKERKVFYGWYVVIGCLLITCTLVPPIMALSSKFLMQVTEELRFSRDWEFSFRPLFRQSLPRET